MNWVMIVERKFEASDHRDAQQLTIKTIFEAFSLAQDSFQNIWPFHTWETVVDCGDSCDELAFLFDILTNILPFAGIVAGRSPVRRRARRAWPCGGSSACSARTPWSARMQASKADRTRDTRYGRGDTVIGDTRYGRGYRNSGWRYGSDDHDRMRICERKRDTRWRAYGNIRTIGVLARGSFSLGVSSLKKLTYCFSSEKPSVVEAVEDGRWSCKRKSGCALLLPE